MAADFDVDFDSPKTSSSRSCYVHGTIPTDATQGYVRIAVLVTSATRNETFYRTIPIDVGTASPFHGTYSVAISPRILSTHTATMRYSFAFS